MARAALRMSVRELADFAKVSPDTIVRLEKGENLKERTLDAVKNSFSHVGLNFVQNDKIEASGGLGYLDVARYKYRNHDYELNDGEWKHLNTEFDRFMSSSSVKNELNVIEFIIVVNKNALTISKERDERKGYPE